MSNGIKAFRQRLNTFRKGILPMEKKRRNYLSLAERTGKLPYTLQNDYLFKAVMEADENILRALLCSLLELKEDEIISVRITNPIIQGSKADEKTTMLDIKVLLNNRKIINLEMQNIDRHDWPERSLIYLCRCFNNIKKGADYIDVIPAHHIGILDFALPHLSKEFYSHFYMMNPKTHEIYSDKLYLSVLNLKHRELATEEDKQWGLDKWAAAFLADTWEEFRMLAADNSVYADVADAIYEAMLDESKREACRRYEEEKAVKARLIREKEDALKVIQEKEVVIQEKETAIQEKDTRIAELEKALAETKR